MRDCGDSSGGEDGRTPESNDSFRPEAVPAPSVKVTAVADAGYSGAWPLGALDGLLHVSVFDPA